MTVSLKHKFNLAKADGVDTTVVNPSDWNNEHDLTAATGKVLGTPKGSTVVTELPIEVDSTGQSLILPSGNTVARPNTPVNGMMRLNTTFGRIEAFLSSAWTAIGRGVVTATSEPTNNYTGDLYFNTSTGVLQIFNGTSFVNISPPNGSIMAAKLVTSLQNAFVPPGSIISYAGAAAPAGFALCFGQALNRTANAALFAAIGTTYGVGDGSTTFNVPDFRGRVPAGADNMGGSAANRLPTTRTVTIANASRSGTEVTVNTTAGHGLSVGESITITGAGNAAFNGTWTVSEITLTGTEESRSSRQFVFNTVTSGTITSVSGGTITATIVGSVNGLVLGATGGASSHTLTVAQMPAHTHGFDRSSNTPDGGSGDNADFNHNPGSTYYGSHTGGDAPHNNVQPTIITNYIIKT